MNLLITDLDGTLANDRWRARTPDYDERQKQAAKDEPFTSNIAFINALEDWHIIILTSRNERWSTLTNKWLLKHNVCIDDLHMRPDDNFEGASDFKVASIKAIKAEFKPDVMVLIDSREDVVMAYRAEGWMALCSMPL